MELLKQWKEKPITIEQFEDMWDQNNKVEAARSYISLLREVEGISLRDKVTFLARLVDASEHVFGSFWTGSEIDSRNSELKAMAARTFLELVPTWNDEFQTECHRVFRELKHLSSELRKGWENKIKTFVHSLLDTKQKEINVFWKYTVPEVLVNNRMFEEMINYDYTGEPAVGALAAFLFPDRFPGFQDWTRSLSLNSVMKDLSSRLSQALQENREPHAVSTLLRLLAKRGDLEKIFSS